MYAAVFHYYEDPITEDYVIYNIWPENIETYIHAYRDERYFKKCYNMEEIPTDLDTVKYSEDYHFVRYD